MIYCVYLNPTIDKTIYLEKLNIGGTNRSKKTVIDGAGKAINVSVVLKELKQDVTVLGFLYNNDKNIIKERLDSKKIPYYFVETEGISRTNTKIFSEGLITEINENGLRVDTNFIDMICKNIVSKVQLGDIVVLTGSLPPGCPKDTYGKLIAVLNNKNVKCIIDADGSVLEYGIVKKPYFIKPNIDELNSIVKLEGNSHKDIINAARNIIKTGVGIVGVSMGSEGALIINNEKAYYAKPLKLQMNSTVGAGDSMVAGIVANLDKNLKLALKAGVAAASASVTLEGTKLCTEELFKKYYEQIEIDEVII